MVRVLKPTGSLFVNLGDRFSNGDRYDNETARRVPQKSLVLIPERYRIACVDQLGLIARAVIVWDKPNSLPESVQDRVRRSHEDWVHLTKAPRYFSAVDEIRERHTEPNGRPSYGRARPVIPGGNRGMNVGAMDHAAHRDMGQNPLGKLPGSVWEIASQPLRVPAELGVDHFAAFPMEWPRRLILGWSPRGGTVLDPFSGTGTTALVATMLGRTGIGVDLSADYGRLAAWRSGDPKERARAAGLNPDAVAAIKPELTGQLGMFGEAS